MLVWQTLGICLIWLSPVATFCFLKQNQLRSYKTIYLSSSDDYSYVNNAYSAREAVVEVLERSWEKVCRHIPQSALETCEDELREATALLVLAAVRRSALTDNGSRSAVQSMFAEADQNNDGQVSFAEWFEWLSDSPSSNESDYSKRDEGDYQQIDPLIDSLGRVLSHAVCSVKVASRTNNEPFFLSAAFIAGGVSSGALDRDVCRAMLTRLSAQTR